MLEEDTSLVDLTVDIVSAYVANNQVATASLADLIRAVHGSLTGLNNPRPVEADTPPKPAVPIKKSITDDYLICLEDGGKYKSLKRHLNSKYGLTPEEYRRKWGLPADYPMVSASYAAARSTLAKKALLGHTKNVADIPPAIEPPRRQRKAG